MTRTTLAVVVIAAAGGVAACLAWPRIKEVETGRTPEYADLQPRTYAAGETKVGTAVKTVIGRLPRWRVVGAASGPRGTDVQAEHASPFGVLNEEVTVRVRSQGGRAQVSVRSRSLAGPWDFGQNARNIRDLLGELDQELGVR
jgi:uncharacterized protein (DUF1499 family)